MNIVERLRQNAEMLKDGHQKNLTELWHSEVVRDAASDAGEAADEIERLRRDLSHAKAVQEVWINRARQLEILDATSRLPSDQRG